MALPTLYGDIVDYEGNLASLQCGCSSLTQPMTDAEIKAGLSGLFPSYVENARITWAQEAAVPLLAGLHGYRRGGLFGAALWALAGYFAPAPTAAVAVAHDALGGAADAYGGPLPLAMRRRGVR